MLKRYLLFLEWEQILQIFKLKLSYILLIFIVFLFLRFGLLWYFVYILNVSSLSITCYKFFFRWLEFSLILLLIIFCLVSFPSVGYITLCIYVFDVDLVQHKKKHFFIIGSTLFIFWCVWFFKCSFKTNHRLKLLKKK